METEMRAYTDTDPWTKLTALRHVQLELAVWRRTDGRTANITCVRSGPCELHIGRPADVVVNIIDDDG